MEEENQGTHYQRQNKDLLEQAQEWPKGIIPDFSPQKFTLPGWQVGLAKKQVQQQWGDTPDSPLPPVAIQGTIPRYQQLNPTIRGQYLDFREGMGIVHRWVNREGAIPVSAQFQHEKEWLKALEHEDFFPESYVEPELAQINPLFRASLSGDWHASQDRWWKRGPQQWITTAKFLPIAETWQNQGWNRKGWSLTGLPYPAKLANKYRKPGDLTSIPPDKI